MAKEIVESKKNEVAVVPPSAMFEDDAGAGFENADREAYAIPFLSILQSGSPQCKKSDGAYVKGAEEGFLFNTVTQDLIDGSQGVLVIPVHYAREFVEWVPREQSGGGGYVGTHQPGDAVLAAVQRNEKGKDVLPNGNLIQDTRNHYVLVIGADGSFVPALVSMVSTQVKKSRMWMSKMDGIKMKRGNGQFFTPPMFSHYYRLTTVPESNDQGSWFGWKIELVRMVDDPAHYEAAKAFREAILSGEMKAAPPQDDAAPTGAAPAYMDDDVPY